MSRKYVGHNMQPRLHPNINNEGTKFHSTDTMREANFVDDSVEFLETRMDSETGRQNRSGFGLNVISHLGNGQNNNTGVINTCVGANRQPAKCYADIRPHKSWESLKKRGSENVTSNISFNLYKTLTNSTNSVPSCNTVAYLASLTSHVPTSHNALGSSSSQPTDPRPLPIVTVAPHGTASDTFITTNATAALTAETNVVIAATSSVSSNSTHVTASLCSSELPNATDDVSSSNSQNANGPLVSHLQNAETVDVSAADANITHDATSTATSASATSFLYPTHHGFQANINQCDIPSRDLTFDSMTTTHKNQDNLSTTHEKINTLSTTNHSQVDLSMPHHDQQNLSSSQSHPNLLEANQSKGINF